MYDAPDGRDFVLKHLPIETMDPVHLLRFSVQHQVPAWFLKSYRGVATLPPEVCAGPEMDALPPAILSALQDTRKQREQRRKLLVDLKPDPYRDLVYCAGCTQQPKGVCYYRMQELYDMHVHPSISRESVPYIHSILKQATSNPVLCNSCGEFYMMSYYHPFFMELEDMKKSARAVLTALNFPPQPC